MKRIYLLSKTIVLLLLMSVVTSACNDFLDRAPTAELDKNEVFSDFELAKKYQLGLYASLRGGTKEFASEALIAINDWGYDILSNLDDHSRHSHVNSSTNELLKGAWTNRDEGQTWGNGGAVARNWRFAYQSIRAINIFLENYSSVPVTAEQAAEMDILVGEAYFLRAHHYFELVKRWGGVPIIDQVINADEVSRPARDNFQACIDFIVADCDRAAERMQLTVSSPLWTGRATKGAAMGIKARALLWAASEYWTAKGESTTTYKEAADAALDVINLNVYELLPNYRDVFLSLFNKEILYSENNPTSQYWDYYTAVPALMGGFSHGMMPTQKFVDCYEILDTSTGEYVPFDWNNPDHVANIYNKNRRDPRFDMTVFYNGSVWQGETLGYYLGGNVGPKEGEADFYLGYCFKKFLNESVRGAEMGGLPAGGTFIFNWIFLRYADILLMYAEAQNKVGGPNSIGGTGTGISALEALNQVRTRRGNGISALPAGISQAEFDIKVRNERSVELVIENQRFFDVKRWNVADTELNKQAGGVIATESGGVFEYDFTYKDGPIPQAWTTRDQWFLYPIHIEEIQRNPNLVQNPGWLDIKRD